MPMVLCITSAATVDTDIGQPAGEWCLGTGNDYDGLMGNTVLCLLDAWPVLGGTMLVYALGGMLGIRLYGDGASYS